MLSLEEQIIDATTDEGKQALKEFEKQERTAAAEESAANPVANPVTEESVANPGHTSDPE